MENIKKEFKLVFNSGVARRLLNPYAEVWQYIWGRSRVCIHRGRPHGNFF